MMKRTTFMISAATITIALSVLGCSTPPEEPTATATKQQPLAPAIAGYRHSIARSKFARGTSLREKSLGAAAIVYEGSDGAATVWSNGFFVATPRAGLIGTIPPLTESSADHSTRVIRYFVDGGLPVDQMGPTHINTLIESTGTVSGKLAGATEASRKLLAYTTIIDRSIDGVRVQGSYAWAQFNKNDDVIAERVWWPDLPSTVRDNIASTKAMLANESAKAAYRAKLPSDVLGEEPEIVIHHSMPLESDFRVFVTLDYAMRGRPSPLSFDASGAPVRFEKDATVVDSSKSPSPP